MAPPRDPKAIALDASAVIDYIKGENHAAEVSRIFEHVERGEIRLVGATILIAEVRAGPRSEPVEPNADQQIKNLLEDARWHYVELDRIVGFKARQLGQELSLKPADAVHLASAIHGGADVFLTGDNRFPTGTFVEGVWVGHPYYLGDPDLFTTQS